MLHCCDATLKNTFQQDVKFAFHLFTSFSQINKNVYTNAIPMSICMHNYIREIMTRWGMDCNLHCNLQKTELPGTCTLKSLKFPDYYMTSSCHNCDLVHQSLGCSVHHRNRLPRKYCSN